MSSPDGIPGLRARLARYPEQRYPSQHAATALQLGLALAGAGQLTEAEANLAAASRLLDPERMPAEAAAAANAWGAVLRMAGRPAEAAAAFRRAAEGFLVAERAADRGAALFNLGLVQREGDDPDAALAALTEARPLLPGSAGTATAVAREIGVTLLTLGRLDDAATELTESVRLAEAAADPAALGWAANALGLTELARGRPDDAAVAFRDAAAAHPRTIRPDGFATAQANLALALERSAAPTRSRFAARQALATPGAPEPVRRQATELLNRIGDDPGVILAILDEEPPAGWPAVLRQELAVWTTTTERDRHRLARAWLAGVTGRPDAAEVMEHWLGAVLELPPAGTTVVLDALMRAVAAADEPVGERLRNLVARALPRYPIPQWTRLSALLDRAAVAAGVPAGWG